MSTFITITIVTIALLFFGSSLKKLLNNLVESALPLTEALREYSEGVKVDAQTSRKEKQLSATQKLNALKDKAEKAGIPFEPEEEEE